MARPGTVAPPAPELMLGWFDQQLEQEIERAMEPPGLAPDPTLQRPAALLAQYDRRLAGGGGPVRLPTGG